MAVVSSARWTPRGPRSPSSATGSAPPGWTPGRRRRRPGPAGVAPDVPREEVFAAAGTSPGGGPTGRRPRQGRDPGGRRASPRSSAGCTARGRSPACFGLGGSAGTTIGTAAMRALPFGVPKLMVSTLASGQVRPYVGVRDVCMMHSVVDISGLNRVSRRCWPTPPRRWPAWCAASAARGDRPRTSRWSPRRCSG